jgi:hypothetical protein
MKTELLSGIGISLWTLIVFLLGWSFRGTADRYEETLPAQEDLVVD